MAAADGWSAAVLPGTPFLLEAARVGGLIVLGVAAYAAASVLLQNEDLAEVTRRVAARVLRAQAWGG
ncbi:MAG: hypothetical protein RDU83_12385 [bacterium]|nr:hypothetical protein [bacterium]